MSDQLRIAGALRKLTDEQLSSLIKTRAINTTNLRDLFDLAEQLASEKSIKFAFSNLSRTNLETLQAIAAGKKPAKAAAAPLVNLLLINPDDLTAYSGTIDQLEKLQSTLGTAQAEISSATENIETVDRDARMAIFELQQAITEVVFDLEQRYIREVGKKSIGLPEVKRLATDLSKPTDYARKIFEICLWSSVAEIHAGRWQLGPNASTWLEADAAKRWQLLATAWVDEFGVSSLGELPANLAGKEFAEVISRQYPLAASFGNSRIGKLVDYAEVIGLSNGGVVCSWFDLLRSKSPVVAAAEMAKGMPQTDAKLIIQADLSLIAPSPLPTDVEIELRNFATTEHIGLATSYRMSAKSVSSALESGITAAKILECLQRLSGKEIPQPVSYLIQDVEKRFGKIKIREDRNLNRAIINSDDRIILAQLSNDQQLKPLSLHFDETGTLLTRFDRDLVYFALRDAGHQAIRVDDNDKVIPPHQTSSHEDAAEKPAAIFADIARLRAADEKLGTADDDNSFVRQIQLAIKLKTKLKISLKTSSGAEAIYLIEPTGLANGRIRGKDRKADVERTLPLDSIVAIELG